MNPGMRRAALVCCLVGEIVLAACEKEAERAQEHSRTAGPVAAVISLTPRQLSVVGIETESVAVTTAPETFATTGEIEFDPARVLAINAPVAGRIAWLTLNVGDQFAAGDTMVTIESPEFLSGGVSVSAPRSGIVIALNSAPQQLVTAGAELLRIASVDRVWLRVDLYGESARLARVGTAVQATLPAYPGLVLRGSVATVAPSVQGETQSVAARVPLDNPTGRLRPGMFADVRIATGRVFRAILVPRQAIIYDGSRRLVMIARDSTFFPSVVATGQVVGDRVVIVDGVNPGERVVVKGGYELYNAGFAFTRGEGEEEEEEKKMDQQ